MYSGSTLCSGGSLAKAGWACLGMAAIGPVTNPRDFGGFRHSGITDAGAFCAVGDGVDST